MKVKIFSRIEACWSVQVQKVVAFSLLAFIDMKINEVNRANFFTKKSPTSCKPLLVQSGTCKETQDA